MNKLQFVLCAALIVFVLAPHTYAQSTPQTPSTEGWRIRLIPYLWGSGFKGRVGVGERSADVDASFSDIFSQLNFAFTATLDASRERFVSLTDMMYMNLSDERATPGPLFSSVDAGQRSFILTPVVGYRLAGSDSALVDVLGGIRYWHLKNELEFTAGLLPGIAAEDTRNWVDGIFALRGRTRISPSWFIHGYGDIGGGGSNLTYQLIGNAGADIGEHIAIVFGYRYLNVNYNKDGFLYDVHMQGPIVGVAFRF